MGPELRVEEWKRERVCAKWLAEGEGLEWSGVERVGEGDCCVVMSDGGCGKRRGMRDESETDDQTRQTRENLQQLVQETCKGIEKLVVSPTNCSRACYRTVQ